MTAVVADLTIQGFLADPHGAKYADVVRSHPAAFARLLELLNDPRSRADLVSAEHYGHPALAGVVSAIEADDVMAASVASLRFRQAVGVAVRLAMESLGWSRTRTKGPLRGAAQFRRAERYAPPVEGSLPPTRTERARAALAAVEQVGDEDERAETSRELQRGLGQTRRAEHRPF